MAKNGEKKNPTQEIVDKYIESLCEEILTHQSEDEATQIQWNTIEEEKKYKICCLVKSQKAFQIYTNLDLCVAIGAKTQSELISQNIDKFSKLDDELEKSLKEAVKSIKEVKNILAEVSDKACKIDRCLEEEERCNPDLLKTLKKGIEDFEDRIKIIKRHPKECYEKAVKAFDGGVDVAGIQSFTDLASLKSMSAELITSIAAFKTDVDQNIISSSTDITTCKTELTTLLQKMETITYKKCATEIALGAAIDTKDYICEPECDKCEDEELRWLCKRVKKNFSDDDEPEDLKNCGCGSGDPEKEHSSSKDQKEEEGGEWNISE